MRRAERRAACASHIGGRSEQQDRAVCLTSRDGSSHLLVVADGMGGHQGGELAARTVIDVAERMWHDLQGAPRQPAGFLEALCQQAHTEIRRRGQAQGLDPYSTLAALLVTPGRAWWVHVGDSRVYLFRDGRLVCRTEDHTLVQHLIRIGDLLESEVADHPERNKLLRGLGGDEPPRATHGRMGIAADTAFVLCTDGFWASVATDEMARLLQADDAAAGCAQWAALAAARGGAEGDNVTVAVLQPERATAGLRLRQLWPLFGALGVALVVALTQIFH